MTALQDMATLLRRHFADLVGTALNTDYSPGAAPAVTPTGASSFLVRFPVRHEDRDGDFVVCFPTDSMETIRSQFLQTNIGEVLGKDAKDEEIFPEIANIIVGHIAGLLAEHGSTIEIMDPGTPVGNWPVGISQIAAASDGDMGQLYCAMRFAAPEPGTVPLPKHAIASNDENALEEPAGEEEMKTRVLIVDDSSVMRAFLKQIFTEAGYEVAGVATDGVEAIEMFESTQPDLMTLDIIMPKMKGTEVLEKILAKYPDASIVMASSVNDARTVMKCLRIGAKRYIIKPYDRDAVIAAAQKALGVESAEE